VHEVITIFCSFSTVSKNPVHVEQEGSSLNYYFLQENLVGIIQAFKEFAYYACWTRVDG
jgi:hypothetical protein